MVVGVGGQCLQSQEEVVGWEKLTSDLASLSHLGRSKTGVSRLSSATEWRQAKGEARDGTELRWLQLASSATVTIKAEGDDPSRCHEDI